MATYTLSSVGFALRWKERIKSLLISGIIFVSMHVGRKLKKPLELMLRRGSCIIPKITNIQKTISCLLLVVDRLLLPNLGMGMQERKEQRLCNFP
jgi:hypothetical protein